jgi:hypothetical protein
MSVVYPRAAEASELERRQVDCEVLPSYDERRQRARGIVGRGVNHHVVTVDVKRAEPEASTRTHPAVPFPDTAWVAPVARSVKTRSEPVPAERKRTLPSEATNLLFTYIRREAGAVSVVVKGKAPLEQGFPSRRRRDSNPRGSHSAT